ncbi:MAG: helix-turn-helix domain-containing protein [Candidatus Omnitrophica bacterium]|nr:helix-turn-helix domain-containing protein [Candidatus Omnitrophota bacterium]
MKEKLLTTREVSQILGISEKEIIDLANANKIPHFKVANEFLRFKKEDILRIKKDIQKKFNVRRDRISWEEKIREFLYFNDFYIISALIILILLYIILKD